LNPCRRTRIKTFLYSDVFVSIQAIALILHFALLQKIYPFYLDNPDAFFYIDINNDYY